MLAIASATAVSWAAPTPPHTAEANFFWLLPTLPLWVLLFRAYGLYERDVKRINHAALDDVPVLAHALLVGTLLTWAYFRVFDALGRLILVEVIAFAIAALVLVPAYRTLFRRGVTRLAGAERVVLIGEASTLGGLARKIQTHPEYGVDPIGTVTLGDGEGPAPGLPILGRLGEIDFEEFVRRHAVDRLIVAHTEVDDRALLDLMQVCGALSVKVSVLPRYFDALGPSVEVDDIEGITVLDLNPLVLARSSRLFKRSMDLVGASVALLITAPIMALAAAAILIDSGRPVLFRQERVGRRGRAFRLLKFRTMVPDAERQTEGLLLQSRDPHWLHLEDDPRVTRVGRFLRKTSLDELPQLINVLRGEMSLVGPRPLLPYQDAQLSAWGRTRLDLAPGITGLWQVLGRTSIPFEEMVKLDTLYVTNWTLWMDVKLLLRTVRSVLTRRGAN